MAKFKNTAFRDAVLGKSERSESGAAAGSSSELLEELVDAAAQIAMFDSQWDDESIPEVKSCRAEFRDAFRAILNKKKKR